MSKNRTTIHDFQSLVRSLIKIIRFFYWFGFCIVVVNVSFAILHTIFVVHGIGRGFEAQFHMSGTIPYCMKFFFPEKEKKKLFQEVKYLKIENFICNFNGNCSFQLDRNGCCNRKSDRIDFIKYCKLMNTAYHKIVLTYRYFVEFPSTCFHICK